MVHRYPAAVKAFYMEPDPQRPELALCVDVLAPEGYGEIIGGSQRMASYDLLLQAHSRARSAGRGVQVVSRSAQVWRRAARRIRHGHRARRGMDLRPGACARDHSVCPHAAPAVSVTDSVPQCGIDNVGSIQEYSMATSPITKPLREHRNQAHSHHRRAAGSRPVAPRRGHGPSAMRVAGLEAKLEALGYDVEGRRQCSRRPGRDQVGRRSQRQVPQGNHRDLLQRSRAGGEDARSRADPRCSGRRPLHRCRNGVGRGGVLSPQAPAHRAALDRRAQRHQHA